MAVKNDDASSLAHPEALRAMVIADPKHTKCH